MFGRHVFRDREEAGRELAASLGHYRGREGVMVLGLARGGVPVARELAMALDLPFDVFIVRKLGAPTSPELAIGAIASGDITVLNDELLRSLSVDAETLQRIAGRERHELARRESVYRQGRPPLRLNGMTVIVTDDGVATGASMVAAVEAIRGAGAGTVVIAVPVASDSATARLSQVSEEVVCLSTPRPFTSVSGAYREFDQVSDCEVTQLLHLPTG